SAIYGTFVPPTRRGGFRHTPLEGGGLCLTRLGSSIGPPRDDSRDPRLPPQTVRRDLADARGWGEYTAAGNTGHKFFEIGRRAAAALGVAQMNACRLGRRAGGESPHPAGTEAAANTGSSPQAGTSVHVAQRRFPLLRE